MGGPNFYNLSGTDKLNENIKTYRWLDSFIYRLMLLLLNIKVNYEIPVDIAGSTPSRSIRSQGDDRTLASNHDALRFLAFRLDFSEYYSRRMGGKLY